MTTIISRLYADGDTAEIVKTAMLDAGLPSDALDVIPRDSTNSPEELVERMGATGLPLASANAYASAAAGGSVVVIARAAFVPFGLARQCIQIAGSQPSVDVGLEREDVYLSGELGAKPFPTVITGEDRLVLSDDLKPGYSEVYGPISNVLGIRLLSTRKSRVRHRGGESWHITSGFFPLLWKRRPVDAVIADGGTPLSTLMGWPLLSKRRERY